jgi:hypothetical protein
MYSADRNKMRDVFFRAWRQHQEQRPLEGIERVIVDIALKHPEYQALLETPDTVGDRDYTPELGESNPFMHMGLHIAIVEQLSIDQPSGIRGLYQQLLTRLADPHAVEHLMMECLAETLWQAQRDGRAPDQNAYLDCLRRLAERGPTPARL